MRILAFIQDPPVIEKILHHIDEPTQPPKVLPTRAPPQGEMEFSPKASAEPWATHATPSVRGLDCLERVVGSTYPLKWPRERAAPCQPSPAREDFPTVQFGME